MDWLPQDSTPESWSQYQITQLFLILACLDGNFSYLISFLRARKSTGTSLVVMLSWKSRCCVVPQVLASSRRLEEEAYPWSSCSRPRNLARISCSRCAQCYQPRFKKLWQNHSECEGTWKIHIWRCSGQFAIMFMDIWNGILASEIYIWKGDVFGN